MSIIMNAVPALISTRFTVCLSLLHFTDNHEQRMPFTLCERCSICINTIWLDQQACKPKNELELCLVVHRRQVWFNGNSMVFNDNPT